MKPDNSEEKVKALASAYYAGASAGVTKAERATAAVELQCIYRRLTAERAPIPDELARFMAHLGRLILSAADPEKALRTALGKDQKEGRPRNTDINRERALRMHRLVQTGMSRDAAAGELDTTPDQSEARKYLRAYRMYQSLAIKAAAEEAWPNMPEYNDPSEAAHDWIAEPMNASTNK